MVSLIEAFNQGTKERVIQRAIASVLHHTYDNPWEKFMQSAMMFKGYLVTFQIVKGQFQVLATDKGSYDILFRRNCHYSLVNFSKRVREWLEIVIFNDKRPASPVKKVQDKRFETYKNRSDFEICNVTEINVMNAYKLGITYL